MIRIRLWKDDVAEEGGRWIYVGDLYYLIHSVESANFYMGNHTFITVWRICGKRVVTEGNIFCFK